MRPKTVSFSMVAADRDGVCAAQTAAGAGNLSLNGTTAGTLDIARHLSIYSAANLSALTFTVTGTDRNGDALTEAITGPNATTVYGEKNFKTVTQVAVSGAVGTNVEIGFTDSCELQWVPVDPRHAYALTILTSDSPDMTWAVEATTDSPWQAEDLPNIVTLFTSNLEENWAYVTTLGNATPQTASYKLCAPVQAVRVMIDDYAAGTLQFKILEGRS